MQTTLTLTAVWVLAACLAGLTPRRYHWAAAWALIASGIPILGLVTLGLGPVWGLIGLALGIAILRWPILRWPILRWPGLRTGQRLAGLLAPTREREHPGE